MKMVRTASIAILVSLMLSPLSTAGHRAGGGAGCLLRTTIADLPIEPINPEESSDLVFIREEEKFARDVYRAMDDLWDLRVFRNIEQAETRHMDAVLALLEKYGITDPVAGTPDGSFVNPDLQALHDQLIADGSLSLDEALLVGATIEDLDIHDLQRFMARTDNEDVMTVYQNLQKGSRNHLRAFVALLEANGVTYTPQFISLVEFEAIISSDREMGRLDANGDLVSTGDCERSRRWKRSLRGRGR